MKDPPPPFPDDEAPTRRRPGVILVSRIVGDPNAPSPARGSQRKRLVTALRGAGSAPPDFDVEATLPFPLTRVRRPESPPT